MLALVRDRGTLLLKPRLYIIRTQNGRSALTKETRNVKINQTSKGVKAHGVKWVSDEPGGLDC
jgi:hypothetical protein